MLQTVEVDMDRRSPLLPLLCLVVGGAAGWWLARMTHRTSWRPALDGATAEPAKPTSTSGVSPLNESARVAERTPVAPEVSGPYVPSLTNDPLISPALRAYAEERLRGGWKSMRADEIGEQDLAEGLQEWEQTVLGSPTTIGIQLAARKTKAEEALADAARGGGFTLLEKLDAGGVGPLPDVVRDTTRFQGLFQRGPNGPSIPGLGLGDHPDKKLSDGSSIVFPAGVFLLAGLMRDQDPFPSDVTIAGAGMNATLLVLGNALLTRGALRNFAVRDCTMHMDGNYLFDLRVSSASMTFDRVRMTGFDTGGGCCCLMGTKGNLFWARDCRFEVGYGRAPWCAGLLDVRTDALLARFERCTLSRVSLNLHWIRDGATVAFIGCNLEELLDAPFPTDARRGILFDGCSISYYAGDRNEVPTKDLNEIFPQWRERMER